MESTSEFDQIQALINNYEEASQESLDDIDRLNLKSLKKRRDKILSILVIEYINANTNTENRKSPNILRIPTSYTDVTMDLENIDLWNENLISIIEQFPGGIFSEANNKKNNFKISSQFIEMISRESTTA
jgi:glycosylphosphatidylinositol transamidase (GPIT) subunit GPI8